MNAVRKEKIYLIIYDVVFDYNGVRGFVGGRKGKFENLELSKFKF